MIQKSVAATAHPDRLSADDFVTIEAGIRDPDPEVRKLAYSGLGRALLSHGQFSRDKPGARPVWRASQETRSRLVASLTDVDPFIRSASVNALAPMDGQPISVELESILAGRFERDGDPDVRRQIIARLANQSAGSPLTQAASLDDSSSDVRQQAALGVATFHPPFGLERLAERLFQGQEKDSEATRLAFISAIATYDDAAAKYVPQLRALRDQEASAIVQRELGRTIAKLQK